MSARGTMLAHSERECAETMKITLSMADMPELIHEIRREVVRMLRERAEAATHPEVCRVLLEVAAEFDAGLRIEEDSGEDAEDG